MRTVHRNAPIIIGAGTLALLLIAPLSLFAEEPAYTGWVVIDAESALGAEQPAAPPSPSSARGSTAPTGPLRSTLCRWR